MMRNFLLALLGVSILASSTLAAQQLVLLPSVQPLADLAIAASQQAEAPLKLSTKRAFFRTMLRNGIERERRGERKRLLRRILGDEDLQTLAIDYADHLQALEPTLAAAEEDADGKFFRFFRYLIENQDAIIQFLEKLIALFEGMAPAAVSFEPAGDGLLLVRYQMPASHDHRTGVFLLRV